MRRRAPRSTLTDTLLHDTLLVRARMPVPAPPPRRGRFLLGIAAAFLATALAATLIGGAIVRDSEGRTERTLQQRLELLAANRVEVIDTWLPTTAKLGPHLTKSDLFRLFATESRLARDADPLAAPLPAQAPSMAQDLTDIVRPKDRPRVV